MIKTDDMNARMRGLLLGTAVGDALGLPAEGISCRRIKRMYGGRWRHRFLFHRGMLSDDTEHTFFVAQSLLAHSHSPEHFGQRLAWCLRGWLLALPAGVGMATAKAILKLWLGISYAKSGVFSAGNGPAMRAAPMGAFFAMFPERIDAFVAMSTRMTHTDPRALTGAKAVAHLAGWIMRENMVAQPSIEKYLDLLAAQGPGDDEWQQLLALISDGLAKNLTVEAFAHSMGWEKGISGYVYQSVPLVLYAWYRHFGDFEKTLTAVLDCGGDTDTTGAIAGALAGVAVGEGAIPSPWLSEIADWPRNVNLLRKVADRLAPKDPVAHNLVPVRYFWPGVLPRNLLFLIVVLLHGFRRLLPPY
jgi:ADP-ribosyl-[dinitrogen reductase] hydrolase